MSTIGCSCCGQKLGEIVDAVVFEFTSFRCESCEREAVKVLAYLTLTGQSSKMIDMLISEDQVDHLISQRQVIIAREDFKNGGSKRE